MNFIFFFPFKVDSPPLSGEREHRKTTGSSSGVSSDLSDSENEHPDHHGHHHHRHHHHHHHQGDDKDSQNESGIFKSSCSAGPASSGDGGASHLANTGTQTPEPDGQLTAFVVAGGGGGGGSKSPAILRHASDYESCEELDDLREECRDLVTRKNSLEVEIEGYKGEIKNLRCRLEEGSGDQVGRFNF